MHSQNFPLSRRRFVTGIAAGAAFAAAPRAGARAVPEQLQLRGNRFDLGIGYREVNFTGKSRTATVINDALPAPVLRFREGEEVTLNVTNNLAVDSSIHWHGLILPPEMDGVPGMSFAGIRPGETFTYRFPVQQAGTYWYHSHSGFQEQTGMYGAIVIEPQEPAPYHYDRDYVVVLSDWSDEKPERIFAKLRKEGHYYNANPRTLGDLWSDIRSKGVAETWRDRAMWNRMRMNDRDISDVTGSTYTFLMNGHTPAANWSGLFRPGEKVLLRFVNAGAMTIFDVRIPGLTMTVVAADGQYVEPVNVEEFRIGSAETYDVIVTPEDGAHTLFAQAIDRSGYARGTLAVEPGRTAPIPPLDQPPVLTHGDMGMAGHGAHGGHQGHGAHHGSMRHNKARHKDGYNVDMRAEQTRNLLADPGIGLRDNGRVVLTYADLRNLYPTADTREPEHDIRLHLTGNMQRYLWSFDGEPFADAEPLKLRLNQRARITLINDTMMNHPIHLHGMWSELETGDNNFLPRKHTVIVQPGGELSYQVTPDVAGSWAYHCHLMFHMMGMFRRVDVA